MNWSEKISTSRTVHREYSPLLSPNYDDKMMGVEKMQSDEDMYIGTYYREKPITFGNERRRWWFPRFLSRPLRILFPSTIFVKFFLASIIPQLSQQLIPLFYTGQIPDESGLALAGQFMFINLVLECIEESVTNSMFNFVGKKYLEDRICSLRCLKLCFLVLLVLGCVLAASLLAFTTEFVKLINTPEEIVEKTKVFLWLSSFSFPLLLLNVAFSNFFYISTSHLIVPAQILQVVGSFSLNFFLFGQHDWSLRWGLNELGFYKVIQGLLDISINLFFLHCIEGMSPKFFFWDIGLFKDFKQNMKALFSVSWANFGDTGLRNFFYFVVTLKFINALGATEAGSWNLLNTTVMSVVLLPNNSVANYVRVLVGHGADSPNIKRIIKRVGKEAFHCLSAWMGLMTIISYTFWPVFASCLSQSNEEVQKLSATMFYDVGWVYILFAFNNMIDSLFYGTGETKYMLYQSIGTNGIVYVVPWILYEAGFIIPSYWLVVGLYIASQLVDMVLTILCAIRMWSFLPN